MQLGLALMHFHHSADGQAHADEDRLTDTNCDRQHLATVNQPPAHRSTTTAAHTHTHGIATGRSSSAVNGGYKPWTERRRTTVTRPAVYGTQDRPAWPTA